MKLSNALRFAKSPLPCFLVLIVVDKATGQRRIFAVHYWKQQISHALLRAREADRDGRSDLNHLTMTLSFRSEDEVGDDVVAWIWRKISAVGNQYSKTKQAITESVGYEKSSLVIKATLGRAGDIAQLVDHQLGLGGALPVEHVEMRNQRFGIEAAHPIVSGRPVFFRMRADPIQNSVSVRLRNTDGDDIALKAEILAPALPNLSDDHWKVRIRSSLLEIVWSNTAPPTHRLNFNFAERRQLQDIEQFAKLIGWGTMGPIDCQVWIENDRLLGARLEIHRTGSEEGIVRLGEIAELLGRVAGPAPRPDLRISVAEILAGGKQLNDFIGLLGEASIDLTSLIHQGSDIGVNFRSPTIIVAG